jgi:hypothetical protein
MMLDQQIPMMLGPQPLQTLAHYQFVVEANLVSPERGKVQTQIALVVASTRENVNKAHW